MSSTVEEPELTRRQWRRLIISGYAPTLISSIGFGGVIPLIPVVAVRLGASAGQAALVTAALGIGQLVGDLPAGVLASHIGDKWAMVLACLLDAAALVTMFFSTSVAMLTLVVFIDGLAGAVFGLARQTYLTEAVPLKYRARALSSLGGVFRIGFFVGPLITAVVVAHFPLGVAFLVAAGTSFTAAVITAALPDLPTSSARRREALAASTAPQNPTISTWTVLREHRFVLLTQGTGIMVLMMIRSARQVIVPLWCEQAGMSASTTSVIFALSMGFETILFFPGGLIMDRLGRWAVVVPSLLMLGIGLALLPLTHTALTISLVGAILGIGNGLSSGVVMTLGSDASPDIGRPQFLAGWRMMSDTGNSTGPLIISAVTVFAPLAVASLVLAGIAWAGAGWLGHWIPDRPFRRRVEAF